MIPCPVGECEGRLELNPALWLKIDTDDDGDPVFGVFGVSEDLVFTCDAHEHVADVSDELYDQALDFVKRIEYSLENARATL